MEYHKYDKKLNGEIHICAVCGRANIDRETGLCMNVQHHVLGREYSDLCIWVCPGTIGGKCHDKIHNPTAFGLPASWAYDNFYLLRRTQSNMAKSCNHKTYFDRRLNAQKCQFCGKTFATQVTPTPKKKSGSKQPSKKMGFDDKQPPHMVEAAKLKTKHDVMRAKIAKEKDPETRAAMEVELAAVIGKMKILQKEHNLE